MESNQGQLHEDEKKEVTNEDLHRDIVSLKEIITSGFNNLAESINYLTSAIKNSQILGTTKNEKGLSIKLKHINNLKRSFSSSSSRRSKSFGDKDS